MPTNWISRWNGQFIEIQYLSILTHEEVENLNRHITSKEIESVFYKNLPTTATTKPLDLKTTLVNSPKCLKKHLNVMKHLTFKEIPITLKLSPKSEEKK